MPAVVKQMSCLFGLVFLFSGLVRASVGGSISGTVRDSSGAVVLKAIVSALDVDTGVQQVVSTDTFGGYSFAVLPVGRYEVAVAHPGFRTYRRGGIQIDANSVLLIDAVLQLGEQSEAATVNETAVPVETSSAQMGELITGAQMVSSESTHARPSVFRCFAFQHSAARHARQCPPAIFLRAGHPQLRHDPVKKPSPQGISILGFSGGCLQRLQSRPVLWSGLGGRQHQQHHVRAGGERRATSIDANRGQGQFLATRTRV
jgi:hypothetical protein